MHELGNITPTLEEFRQYAATRRVIPVRTTVLADSLTPVGLYRALVTREGEPARARSCSSPLRRAGCGPATRSWVPVPWPR